MSRTPSDRRKQARVRGVLHAGRAVSWLLTIVFAMQTVSCGARTPVTVLPSASRVSMISPWRYYDLWQALGRGRGVMIGTTDGRSITGAFVSGGAKTIQLNTTSGYMSVPVSDIRYLVNVLDLSHARDGAIAGGLIGLGTGFALSYMANGQSNGISNPASRPAVATRIARIGESEYDYGEDESSTGESTAAATPNTASASGGQSTISETYDTGTGASSQSSAGGGDPTATGSSTYGDESASSGGSSAGGGGTSGDVDYGSSESSGNSVVYVNIYADNQYGSSGSSEPTSRPGTEPSQPSGGGSSPAVRTFFYTVTFAAIGTLIGWTIGRRIKRDVPRVDYALFPANLDDQAGRTTDQYLADHVVQTDSKLRASETLLVGSGFDSPRSAAQFDQLAHDGIVIQLHEQVGSVITASSARAYGLFPTIDGFEQAVIVQVRESQGGVVLERSGSERRYLAIVTRHLQGAPVISLQRMSPRDIVTLSTQIGLIHAGVLQ